MPVTGNTDYESTAVAKRQIDARERAHACTHTHTRILSFPLPVSQRVPSPNVFPLNSSARRKRPAAATAGISCSRTTASHAADSSSQRHPRERKKERERETEREREREPRCLSAASAVRRRREHSIGRLWTARSRRGEEGGRSAKQSAAERSTYAEPAFCRLPPCRVQFKVFAPYSPRRRSVSQVCESVPAPSLPDAAARCAAGSWVLRGR